MTPYHEGELAMQERAGERRQASVNGRLIASRVPAGALPFVARQRMAVVATLAADGAPVVSVVFGRPGFISSADGSTVQFHDDHLYGPAPVAPAEAAAAPRMALLLIEFETRRRLRINGRVRTAAPEGIVISVDEAYPNCPKYIQRRSLDGLRQAENAGASEWRPVLNAEDRNSVTSADTFFVGSVHPRRGLDASHRGGLPGFVRVDRAGDLSIPDYDGNSMFNTLGNLLVEPRVCLAFLDFESTRVLEVRGAARVVWNRADDDGRSGGTGRFWEFHPVAIRTVTPPVVAEWKFLEYSPVNPETGNPPPA